jgi:histidinol-phosphate aminotransferase
MLSTMTIQSKDIAFLIRKNIREMKPYSSARDEFKGEAEVYLDANENPYPNGYNRYPDPLQWEVKEALSVIKGCPPEQIFLGNGSDEPIDLLIRAFCEPGIDSILLAEPTYGMYSVCAAVNNVNIQRTQLTPDFDIDSTRLFASIDASTKIIFLCSPNNPSGNLVSRQKIQSVLERFNGLVVVDEAYIDFADTPSLIQELTAYTNLVVLQTFSKAWGLAGLRLGMCFASTTIINVLNKIKYPYNVNIQTQRLALEALRNKDAVVKMVEEIKQQRDLVATALKKLPVVTTIYPSDANFLLVKMKSARKVYELLLLRGIILRDRSNVKLCDDCLRITIGTPVENKRLLDELTKL